MVRLAEEERNIIFQSRKSLLFHNNTRWMKKNGQDLFDVTMGSYDGAEVCELVGTFILSQLCQKLQKQNVGLYRDDGLAVLLRLSGPQTDRMRKAVTEEFKKLGLRITIQCNIKTTDYLDLTLDLRTGKYCPYRKPNDRPLYINRQSNHPPSVQKNLTAGIRNRINRLSSDEECFSRAAPMINDALKSSSFNDPIQFTADRQSLYAPKKKKRRRRITWFNPPFSESVATNIGRCFLELVKKHFPKGSVYIYIYTNMEQIYIFFA